MEKQILDILNAGLGIVKSGQEGLEKAKADFTKSFQELAAKGASDNSEASVRVREFVDKFLNEAKELTTAANKTYEDSRAKALEIYSQIVEEAKKIVPQEQIDAIKAKFSEVTETVVKKATPAPAAPAKKTA
ncbi:chemotaxis protein [Leptospira langatensis]|uniref:Chemotaxis protein n=1 Tax=Leptospira langatensis TaxID=2484983 RepID=A0A5F1ZX61_9LEPT|nr:chemotaxis protein [Leptospira langatensis]TGK01384.1 chemotaxis protein [Leptospira langatensis]TGL42165.1 chemotaxis protein [Leptospira langatensis]